MYDLEARDPEILNTKCGIFMIFEKYIIVHKIKKFETNYIFEISRSGALI